MSAKAVAESSSDDIVVIPDAIELKPVQKQSVIDKAKERNKSVQSSISKIKDASITCNFTR